MKKIIVILMLFLLTGCDSTEVFNKKCTQNINTPDLNFKQNINFTYNNKDELLKIKVINNYNGEDIKDIKDSAYDYNNTLAKESYAKIEVLNGEDNIYRVKYILDVSKMENEDLERFNLQRNWIKLNNKINQSNFTCK